MLCDCLGILCRTYLFTKKDFESERKEGREDKQKNKWLFFYYEISIYFVIYII